MSLTGMGNHIRLLEEAELVKSIGTWLQQLDRFAHIVERTKGAR